jgi:hypothetical protein
MSRKRRNGPRAIAAFLLLSVLQISLQAVPSIAPQLAGRLKTSNNQPVMINGLSANTGASVLSGATIETGADQSATVDLGPLGSIEISPNSKVILTFEQGTAKATVVTGCATVKADKGTTGEIATEQGSSRRTDPAAGGTLDMCFPERAAPPTTPSTEGGGGLFGLGRAATIAIFSAAGAAALTPLWFQDNPSGSNP